MGDKNKYHFKFLLSIQGKKSIKVELFNSSLWNGKGNRTNTYVIRTSSRYRVKVNGHWYRFTEDKKYTFLTRYEVRDLIWKSYKGVF